MSDGFPDTSPREESLDEPVELAWQRACQDVIAAQGRAIDRLIVSVLHTPFDA